MKKAIKTQLFKYALETINTILDSYLDENIKNVLNSLVKSKKNKSKNKNEILKRLKYKIIKDNQKKNELNLFKMTFKELFKYEIGGDFKSFSKDSNKIIIETIESNYKQINPNIRFILDLQFGDWIDFFTYKKEIKEFENIKEEKHLEIKRSDILLDEIAKKNDNKYFSLYSPRLMNYKEMFS